MKILTIPDIHGNFDAAIKNIDDHIADVDKVVVLGDYFDSFDPKLNGHASAEGFRKLMKKAEDSDGKIDLLLGNHDLAYITDPNVSGHQHGPCAIEFLNLLLDARDKKLLNIAVEYDGRVYSHAGFSSVWADSYFKDVKKEDLINEVNKQWRGGPLYMFTFSSWDFSRCGEDSTQGPLWIRPSSLLRYSLFPCQVVGHTEVQEEYVKNGRYGLEHEGTVVYLCDSASHDHWTIFEGEENDPDELTTF